MFLSAVRRKTEPWILHLTKKKVSFSDLVLPLHPQLSHNSHLIGESLNFVTAPWLLSQKAKSKKKTLLLRTFVIKVGLLALVLKHTPFCLCWKAILLFLLVLLENKKHFDKIKSDPFLNLQIFCAPKRQEDLIVYSKSLCSLLKYVWTGFDSLIGRRHLHCFVRAEVWAIRKLIAISLL